MLLGEQSDQGVASTMTLIAEKLRGQHLCDRPREAYSIGPHTEKLRDTMGLYPYESLAEEKLWGVPSGSCGAQMGAAAGMAPGPSPHGAAAGSSTWIEAAGEALLPGWISDMNLNESSTSVLAPPTKRHCRSLSEPDELSRSRSPWKPGNGSKIWTPISKQRCNSGGVALLQAGGRGSPSHSPSSVCLSVPCSPFGRVVSPLPRPSSASSGFADCSGRSSGASSSSGAPWPLSGPPEPSTRRRLSLSQEHLPDGCDPMSMPQTGRWGALPRCRSQPCVLQERKAGVKRPREAEARWSRPSLDLLKMTQTLKNSKSLCSLDDEDLHTRTIVSSPCGSTDDLVNLITPGSSPVGELSASRRAPDPRRDPLLCPPRLPAFSQAMGASESDEDSSDSKSVEEGILPLCCGDLDLEQIENN